MGKAPCYECGKRTQGCHGSCEEYGAFREKIDKIKDEKRKERELEEFFSDALSRLNAEARKKSRKYGSGKEA